MHVRIAAALLLGSVLGGCGDDAAEGPDPSASRSVCPSCEERAGGETADFGELPGPDQGRCPAEPAPLTDAVAAAFELDGLRSFLEGRPLRSQGRYVQDAAPPGPGSEPVELELRVELGEIVYHETTISPEAEQEQGACDSVRAPARLELELGDGLLALSATGVLWKEAGRPDAFLYARAELARATGRYEPELDTSRPHTGHVELAFHIFPGQLRGEVIAQVLYFDGEQALQEYLDDEPYGGNEHVRESLFQLELPIDDCEDSALPIEPDAEAPLLGERSPRALWQEAAMGIAELTALDAVWANDDETELHVELVAPRGETACLESERAPADLGFTGTELLLHVPTEGRLSTGDGRIDAPVTEVVLALGYDDRALRRARVRSVVDASELSEAERAAKDWPGDRLDAWVTYSFDDGGTRVDGLVELQDALEGNTSWTPMDCLALPPGGTWDTDHCRYER